MRYALAVASIVACWSGGAFGAEMPKDLRGSWCTTEYPSEKLVKCKKGEEDWVIARKSLCIEDGCCEPLSVRKQGKNAWIIKERCLMVGDENIARTIIQRYVRTGVYLYVKEP